MRHCLEKLKEEVSWPWETMQRDSDLYEVSCDAASRTHTFFVGSDKESSRDAQLLRCLAHASLAENIHPLFSAVVVEGPDYIGEKVFERQIWPVFCISRTWFADGLIANRCPVVSRSDVERKTRIVNDWFQKELVKADLNHILQAALVVAEAKSFFGVEDRLSGKMKDLVQAFIDVDPFEPSLENLSKLNNGLLGSFSSFSTKCHSGEVPGNTVWRVS